MKMPKWWPWRRGKADPRETPYPTRHNQPEPGLPGDLELDTPRGPVTGPVPDPALLRLEAEQQGLRDGAAGVYDDNSFHVPVRHAYLVELDRRRDYEIREAANRARADQDLMDAHEVAYTGDVAVGEHLLERTRQRMAEAETREKEVREELAALRSDGSRPTAPWVGTSKPRKPWRHGVGVLIALAVLAGVEVPIHYGSFEYLRHTPTMTWILASTVSLAMVLGPHGAGHWARRRHIPGGLRVPVIGATAIILLWLIAVIGLARFRQVTLLSPQSEDEGTDWLVENGFGPGWAVVVFAAVLLLSGAIAIMLGFMGEHPHVQVLREAIADRERLDNEVAGVLRDVQSRRKALTGIPERRRRLEEAWEDRRVAITQMYADAEAAYRHAVAQAMRDPDLTDAAGDRSRHGAHDVPHQR